ncbi:MAG: tetratricopeptide repeat protein [Gammaproteobacteria bacterium]|nr:tetratricopeptide repeat protein [Gammaproteobacteria bacterium]
MSQLFDIDASNFNEVVINGSAANYVVVDFWAPWCNPCQQLKPLLERLAPEYGYLLAKVNTEEQQQLALEHGVRGIPDVRIYHEGRVVENFSGALSEAELRKIFDRYMTSQASQQLLELEAVVNSGDSAAAISAIEKLLSNDSSDSSKLTAARYFIRLELFPRAVALLQEIRLGSEVYDSAQSLLFIETLRENCPPQEPPQSDNDRDYNAACCAVIHGNHEEALQRFLELIKRDKGYRDGAARKAMLTLFTIIGSDDPIVKQYQRKLALYMY